MTARTSHRWIKLGAVAVTAAVVAAACGGGGESGSSQDPFGDAGDCTVIDVAVSSEKIDVMTDLAQSFNGSEDADLSDGCAFVRPYAKASGAGATALADGWDSAAEGPRPVIWSPAASSWGKILNQRLADAGQEPMAADDPESFMLTPLVIAMPKPMADALGYPETPIGWSDIAALATSDEGWAAYGHPEWGDFKLGKTNPNFSTSGLSALIGQTYAATGKTRDLTGEDLNNPAVGEFARQVESAVVHYGDITMTFLNNWFRTDRNGTSLLYASAVAVEEKSLIDYNNGNPDGVLEAGEQPRKPNVPLVAIYPKEGTLYSDNPLFVLDADWVDEQQAEGAEAFIEVLQRPENQEKVLSFGFRPGNPEVAIGDPIIAANGVDPDQPAELLQVPEPPVMISLLERWREQRKGARVQIVIDVSGSMAEPSDGSDRNSPTKLELAKTAAIDALDEFKSDDEVGLRIFSNDLGPDGANYLDVLEVQPMSTNRELLRNEIRNLIPQRATPLYEVAGTSFADMVAGYDPAQINAIVLLTDGVNDDGDTFDDNDQLNQLLTQLDEGTNGENALPVRVFTIAYGSDADLATLTEISQATNAAAYDASNPETISKVFTAVVSNF